MSKEANQEGKILIHIFKVIFSTFIYLIVLPVLVVSVANYIKHVVQGDLYYREYLSSFPEYSYKPVLDFYWNLWGNITEFVEKMKNTKIFD